MNMADKRFKSMDTIKRNLAMAFLLFVCQGSASVFSQITERPRPKEWDNLVEGSRFIDRFLPMSEGKLSAKVWGGENVVPRFIDNGIEDVAKLGVKVIDRLSENPDEKSLVIQKNCINKYLATVKGKANLSENFISSVTDLHKFMVKLCEIFKFSQNGSYGPKNIISFMDEILNVDKDMTKVKYDLYYDFFVAKTDDEGENISLLTKLQTVSDLANELILAISNDNNDKPKLKFETYGTDDNTDKSLLRDDEEILSNGTISRLVLLLTNICTTIFDRVSEFEDLTKGVEKLKSINGVKLDESRQKMFNAFAMCIVSFADAFSSFVNFTFDFYAYLSNFIAFNKSTFTSENPLAGIN